MTANMQTLIASKSNQQISTSDLDSVINSTLQDKIGPAPSFDTLPEIDESKIKIKKQDYDNLSDSDKKQKLYDDLREYVKAMATLFVQNIPDANVGEFKETFQDKLSSLSTDSPDYQYFRDFTDKLKIMVDQANEIDVPETVKGYHIKVLRLSKAFIAIKDDPSLPNIEDPIGTVVIVNKVQALALLASDLMTDFGSYIASIKQ